MTKTDIRFDVPLYTIADAASVVGVPPSTFHTWANGYVRRPHARRPVSGAPILTCLPSGPREPSIPFVGLAEGLALAAVRRSGVPLQRIRPALETLKRDLGSDYALASRRLYTDGAELLFDYGDRHPDDGDLIRQLVVVRSGQHVFVDVIADYLQRIDYAADGYARLIRPPGYTSDIVCDPKRSFGQPIFTRGGARVADVLARFQAGESLTEVSAEFGVPVGELEDALRVASRRAA